MLRIEKPPAIALALKAFVPLCGGVGTRFFASPQSHQQRFAASVAIIRNGPQVSQNSERNTSKNNSKIRTTQNSGDSLAPLHPPRTHCAADVSWRCTQTHKHHTRRFASPSADRFKSHAPHAGAYTNSLPTFIFTPSPQSL